MKFCNQCNTWFEDRDIASDAHLVRHIGNEIDGRNASSGSQNNSGAGAALLLLGIFYLVRPIYRIFLKHIQKRWPNTFLHHRYSKAYSVVAFVVSIYLSFNALTLLGVAISLLFTHSF